MKGITNKQERVVSSVLWNLAVFVNRENCFSVSCRNVYLTSTFSILLLVILLKFQGINMVIYSIISF